MKKLLMPFVLFAGMWNSPAFCQVKSDGFSIKLSVPKMTNGQKAYLKADGKPGKPEDSTVVKDGIVKFTGTVPYPQLYTITIANPKPKARFKYAVPVFLENSKVDILAKLDTNMTELELLYAGGYPYDHVVVKGSPSHELFVKYNDGYQLVKKPNSDAFNAYIDYLNPGKGKEKGPVSEGIGLVEQIDATKEVLLSYVKRFVNDHRSSPVALYVANKHLGSLDVNEIDELLAGFSPEMLASEGGKQLAEKAESVKKTAVGAQYVDFAFNDKDGKPVKLSDYAGRGKYTLLEFWASWCGPCRADIPHLKEAYELYHPAGFEVVSISMDSEKDKWLKAVEEEQMSWAQVSDLKAFDGDFSKIYNFNAIPTCVLVGPDGKIITRNMRGLWMDKKLIELYGNKFGARF